MTRILLVILGSLVPLSAWSQDGSVVPMATDPELAQLERSKRALKDEIDKAKAELAQAKATAEGIIAKAKADAARIQDEARAKDPELYLFLKKIDAMKELLRSNKTIILVPLPGKTLPKEAEFLWDFLKPFKQTAPAKKTDMTKKDTNRSETIRELWRQELGGVIRQMIEENRLQILEADTVSSPLLIPMQVLPKKN